MSKASDKKWLQNAIDKFDLGDEFFDLVMTSIHDSNLEADEDGAEEVYSDLLDQIDDDEAEEYFTENKEKVIKGLIIFIDDQLRDLMEEDEEIKESVDNEFVTKNKPDTVKEIDTKGEPIQDVLSDRAFKYLYTFEELRQRTKKVQWMNDQILAMIEKGEKLNEIQKMVVTMEESIKNLADYYKKRYEVKLGYIQNQLSKLTDAK